MERPPDISIDTVLEILERQAEARWDAAFREENRELLQQAATYIANIANNLPDAETEPGFFQ